MAKGSRLSSEPSPRPQNNRSQLESMSSTGVRLSSYPSKVELDGEINQTKTTVDISELTEGAFIEGFGPPRQTLSRNPQVEERFSTEESFAESIIGSDDRVHVQDPSAYPFNMICYIVTEFNAGTPERSTGWFGGNHTLFTAGHCVHKRSLRGYARRIKVWSPTMGELTATDWITTDAWANSEDPNLDIGAIKIKEKADSFMGFEAYPPEFLKKARISVFGYPGDKSPRDMWGHANGVARVYDDYMTYVLDTFGGQSGAPVFTMISKPDGPRPYVLGIHNYGVEDNGQGRNGLNENACTRINSDVYGQLKAWKSKYDV